MSEQQGLRRRGPDGSKGSEETRGPSGSRGSEGGEVTPAGEHFLTASFGVPMVFSTRITGTF